MNYLISKHRKNTKIDKDKKEFFFLNPNNIHFVNYMKKALVFQQVRLKIKRKPMILQYSLIEDIPDFEAYDALEAGSMAVKTKIIQDYMSQYRYSSKKGSVDLDKVNCGFGTTFFMNKTTHGRTWDGLYRQFLELNKHAVENKTNYFLKREIQDVFDEDLYKNVSNHNINKVFNEEEENRRHRRTEYGETADKFRRHHRLFTKVIRLTDYDTNWLKLNYDDEILVERETLDSSTLKISNVSEIKEGQMYEYALLAETGEPMFPPKLTFALNFEFRTVDTNCLKILVNTQGKIRNFETYDCVLENGEYSGDINLDTRRDSNFIVAIEDLDDRATMTIKEFFPHPGIPCDFTIKVVDSENKDMELDDLEVYLLEKNEYFSG